MTDIDTLTELCRRQAHRIEELEAALRALMIAADWHVSSVGEAIDSVREHLDAD